MTRNNRCASLPDQVRRLKGISPDLRRVLLNQAFAVQRMIELEALLVETLNRREADQAPGLRLIPGGRS